MKISLLRQIVKEELQLANAMKSSKTRWLNENMSASDLYSAISNNQLTLNEVLEMRKAGDLPADLAKQAIVLFQKTGNKLP